MITKLVKVDAERPDLNVLREAADTDLAQTVLMLRHVKKYMRLRADRAIIRLY